MAITKVRGLTLIELMVTLGLLAVLASLALPSFGAHLTRQRLKAAAEALAADLAEARLLAAQRGSPLHVHFDAGADWCWTVATASGCGCAGAQPACLLKTVAGRDHPGVALVQGHDALFDPASGTAVGQGSAELRTARGERLRVELSRLGRARICSPGASLAAYPAC
jgi:type IV fimbrial biogenesis protein FimT